MTRLDYIQSGRHFDEDDYAHHLDFLAQLAFQALVVRQAQKEYFKSRGTAELQASKIAERELDQLLATPWPPKPVQGELL